MSESKKIGRRVTFKYYMLGFIALCLIPILMAIYEFFFENNHISIGGPIAEAKDNALFLIIQIAIIIVAIYFFGGRAGNLIIKYERKPFWISLVSIMAIWISLLIGSALIAGVENSFKFGFRGFKSTATSWMIYGFIIFLILGGFHGLISSIWMGKEIKKKGQRHRNNRYKQE